MPRKKKQEGPKSSVSMYKREAYSLFRLTTRQFTVVMNSYGVKDTDKLSMKEVNSYITRFNLKPTRRRN